MLIFPEINALGQILNTSWGHASTEPGTFPLGTCPNFSVKGHIVGDIHPDRTSDVKMVLTYTTIITFTRDHELVAQKRRYAREAEQVLKKRVQGLKKDFRQAAGRALKLKQQDDAKDSFEVIYTQAAPGSFWLGPRENEPAIKRAYYRYVCVFDVS